MKESVDVSRLSAGHGGQDGALDDPAPSLAPMAGFTGLFVNPGPVIWLRPGL